MKLLGLKAVLQENRAFSAGACERLAPNHLAVEIKGIA